MGLTYPAWPPSCSRVCRPLRGTWTGSLTPAHGTGLQPATVASEARVGPYVVYLRGCWARGGQKLGACKKQVGSEGQMQLGVREKNAPNFLQALSAQETSPALQTRILNVEFAHESLKSRSTRSFCARVLAFPVFMARGEKRGGVLNAAECSRHRREG